ncbi:MAG: RNA polymerase sigma factor [Dehalococcoidia bacterium]
MNEDESGALDALRAGDIAGLNVLVRQYQTPALHLAFNLCGNQQVAEDAVADAFLAVLKHIRSYDTSRPFKSWFYRIVINCVRSAVRRDRRLPTVPDAGDLLQRQADPGPAPDVDVMQSELEAALLQQIDQLPPKQREVIVLRYYLDLDERTMSRVLSVPIGTVKWRLFQAHKKLHRQMSEGHDMYGYFSEEGQRS